MASIAIKRRDPRTSAVCHCSVSSGRSCGCPILATTSVGDGVAGAPKRSQLLGFASPTEMSCENVNQPIDRPSDSLRRLVRAAGDLFTDGAYFGETETGKLRGSCQRSPERRELDQVTAIRGGGRSRRGRRASGGGRERQNGRRAADVDDRTHERFLRARDDGVVAGAVQCCRWGSEARDPLATFSQRPPSARQTAKRADAASASMRLRARAFSLSPLGVPALGGADPSDYPDGITVVPNIVRAVLDS